MTLANATVLHAHFRKIGRLDKALQLEKRYPELAAKPEPKKENGKKPTGRTK
jgi:hypothetical protein